MREGNENQSKWAKQRENETGRLPRFMQRIDFASTARDKTECEWRYSTYSSKNKTYRSHTRQGIYVDDVFPSADGASVEMVKLCCDAPPAAVGMVKFRWDALPASVGMVQFRCDAPPASVEMVKLCCDASPASVGTVKFRCDALPASVGMVQFRYDAPRLVPK